MDTNDKNNISVAIEAGRQLAMAQSTPNPSMPFALVPAGYQAVDLEKYFLAKPRRCTGTRNLTDMASFASYVNRFQIPGTSIFRDDINYKFQAILDCPENQDKPDWCDFRANYACVATEEFAAWVSNQNKIMTQAAFAEFLEERSMDVVEPSSASLVEMCRTMRAKKDADYQGGVDLATGQFRLNYNETIRGTVGTGEIEIPAEFKLHLPIFWGGQRYQVTCRLRWRLTDGKVTFYYLIGNRKKIQDAAFADVAKFIATECKGIPVFGGAI